MQLWEYEAVTEADPDDLIIFSRDGVQYYSVSVKDSGLKDGLKYWTETETEIYNSVHGVLSADSLAGNAWISGAGIPRFLGMKWHKKYYETDQLLTYGALSALSPNGAQPENSISPLLITTAENPQNMSTALLSPSRVVSFSYGPKKDWYTNFSLDFGKVNPHFYICRGTLKSFCLTLTDNTVAPHDGTVVFRTYDEENRIETIKIVNNSYTETTLPAPEEAMWHDLDYVFIITCMGSSAHKYTDYPNDDYILFSCDDPQTTTQFGRHGTQETNSIFGDDMWKKTWTEADRINRTVDWRDASGIKIGTVNQVFTVSDLTTLYAYFPCGIGTIFDYEGATWKCIMVPLAHYFGSESPNPEHNDLYFSFAGPEDVLDGEMESNGEDFGALSDIMGNRLLHPALRGYDLINKHDDTVLVTRNYEYIDLNGVMDHITYYEERYNGFTREGLESFRREVANNANDIFKTIIKKYLKLNVYKPQIGGGGSDGAGIRTEISVNEKKGFSTGILGNVGDTEEYYEKVSIDPLTGKGSFTELFEKHGNDETRIRDILQVKLKPSDGIHISDDNVISATFGDDVDEILQEKILSGGSVGVTYDNGAFIFSKDHVLNGYVTSLQNKVPVYSARSTDEQTGTITDALYFNLSDLKEKVELPIVSEGAGIDISATGKVNSYGVTQVSVNGLMQTKDTENNQNYIDIDSSYFNPNTRRSRSVVNTKYISGYPVEYIKKEHGYFSKDVDLSDLYNRVAALEEAVINQGGE